MWNEPYLETCCRSALHRLMLVGAHGRPPALKDGPCLNRLAGMGLAAARPDGRYEATDAGRTAHGVVVMRRARTSRAAPAAPSAAAPAR